MGQGLISPDWELFWGIREDVHATASDIPIKTPQGLYPTVAPAVNTAVVMGFPTFTFETDDEQRLGASNPAQPTGRGTRRHALPHQQGLVAGLLDVTSLEVNDGSKPLDCSTTA